MQSRFLAVGSVVPWAEAGAGAVATQAIANTRFGPLGLALLKEGLSAEETLAKLITADPDRELRQVGVVDRQGRVAAFTGAQCIPWAGHLVDKHFCCQGNILAGEAVVAEMAKAMQHADQPFVDRLLAALQAGQSAGGDSRGQQAAALLVVRRGAGVDFHSDRAMDLRVDDHPTPIRELQRLVGVHREVFGS